MGEVLIKPYELSIWDNELTNTEQKIAVIGTHLLRTPNMAYDIIFRKDKNGEKTLSFKIKNKYYDANTGQIEENPFAPYLINERKVKLFYDDEWYDFIIKEVEETTEEYTWSYVAYDAFILELSKNGYGVEFSSELNNNLGTALELASKALEDTDWEVIDVDTAAPKVNEPVFQGTILTDITVKNMDNDEDVSFEAGTSILIFYSYITNKNGKFLQFILAEANTSDYNVDSTNTITATNYRFDYDLDFETIESGGHTIYYINDLEGNHLISYSYVYQIYEAYRVIYQQVQSYDAIMDRIVDQYIGDGVRINHYTDYVYTTSNLVTSFVANGDNFSTHSDGTLYGWDRYGGAANTWPDIELTTYPEIDPENPIMDLDGLNQIEGYLQVKFNAGEGSYLYNDGISMNQSYIESIAKGDKFVFRWRGGKASTDHGTLTKMAGTDLRAKVCFYRNREVTSEDTTRYVKDPISDIISFEGTPNVLNNVISGGTLENNDTQYILNGVEQVPSSKYLYATDLHRYYWDSDLKKYVLYNESTNTKFLDYYYLTGTALTTVTPDQFKDSTILIGIFIYCNGSTNNWYYLQDIQLTRLYKDEADNILTIGNVPRAVAQSTDYYYLTPKEGDTKNKISLFLTLEDLANEYGLNIADIKPVYNQGNILFTDTNDDIFWAKKELLANLYQKFEVQGYALSKVSTIEAARTNYFDILQTIAEAFECWIDIYVEHNDDGSIYLDDEDKPLKTILLREFSGSDNFAGFKYGINIDSITRTVDSNEVVTKLIVDDVNSDLTDDGVISIAQAESNPNKEQYIYRFDYFLNQGLLPRDDFMQDLNEYNLSLKQLNTTLYDLQQQSIQLTNSLRNVNANRVVYNNLLLAAGTSMNDALDEFESITGYAYEEYQQASDEQSSGESQEQEQEEDEDTIDVLDLLKIDKISEIIGTIYNCAATENSYRGLYTNIETEYMSLYQQLNGLKEHSVVVSCVSGETSWYLRVKLDDYIVPFKFTVDEVEYEASLANKEFEIEINSNTVDITNILYNVSEDTGYQLLDNEDNLVTTIHATNQKVQTFRLVPNTPTEGVNARIDELIEEKKDIIKQFSNKYRRFILEGTWSSQDYLSDDLYYLDAAIAGRTNAFPKVTYAINVVDVSGLDEYQAYNFNAGDKTFIEDTEFFGWTEVDGVKTPVKEEVIISDIEWHLDDPSQNSITVQNYKSHFEDLFQRVQATVQTVQYNEVTYPNTGTIIDEEKRINQALLVASLSRVAGEQRPLTTDGSIVIDGDSIDILNLTNRLNRIRMSSEGITISSDGGATWSAAITGEGINIGNVISDFINTKEVWIGNRENPSYRWDSNGISAFRLGNTSEGEPKYDFKQFVRFDQYGLYGIDLNGANNVYDGYDYVVRDLDDVKNDASFAVTWDGFFIKSKYTNGKVEISSTDDIRVLNLVNNNWCEIIKIGALEWEGLNGDPVTDYNDAIPDSAPIKYGIRIKNLQGQDMFVTGNDGNLAIMNELRVGAINSTDTNPHIVINGQNAYIKSSNYSDGAGSGWMINKDGDAFFNNITARGAIKTAVFEYAEIQAVGGVFLFRPSSTIRNAIRVGITDDIQITVEKPYLFSVGDWCKVSNYTNNMNEPDATAAISNNGLTHVYKVKSIDSEDAHVIVLENAFTALTSGATKVVDDITDVVGGALVNMGNTTGTANYGIGINSSDNTVNLPARAISLFNTTINTNANPKITYDYTAILGTLPTLSSSLVNTSIFNTYMKDTQGIYTDNMYIGDAHQYIAFYTDKASTPAKHMDIKVKEFTLETSDDSQDAATNGYIYFSNSDKLLTGDLTAIWRLIIGPNFRVDNVGNLYATNVDLTGKITATSGKIGNWDIENPTNNTYGGAIKTGTFGTNGGVYITPGYTTTSTAIEGTSASKTWTITAGNKFGVTTDGKLYASDAIIQGAVTATSGSFTGTITANGGSIGGWQIGTDTNKSLHNGSANTSPAPGSGVIILSKGITTSAVGNLPAETYAITAGTNFGVTTAGAMYVKSGNIAGWEIGTGSLSYGTIDNSSTSKLYLGTADTANYITIGNSGSRKDWRLLAGNKFGVDDEGNLYASNANISGTITATAGTIGGASISNGVLKIGDANIDGRLSADVIDTSSITVSSDRITSGSSSAIISGDGMVINKGGTEVASFGNSIILGPTNSSYVLYTSSTNMGSIIFKSYDDSGIGQIWSDATDDSFNISCFNGNLYLSCTNGIDLVTNLVEISGKLKVNSTATNSISTSGSITANGSLYSDTNIFCGYSSSANRGLYSQQNSSTNISLCRFCNSDSNYKNTVYLGDSDYKTRIIGSAISANNTISTGSDIRLKKNIKSLDYANNIIMNLDTFEFSWNGLSEEYHDDGKKYFGISAQQLIELINQNGLDIKEYGIVDTNSSKYYTVSYSSLIPLLIRTVQELNKRIQQLENLNNK